MTARRRASLPAPSAPKLPPHPESPPAPATSLPRFEQPPVGAHPADVVPDAVADAAANAALAVVEAGSPHINQPESGLNSQQASQASPPEGHAPDAERRGKQASAPAAAPQQNDRASRKGADAAEGPGPGSSPLRVPPLRLVGIGGGAGPAPQAVPRWVDRACLAL